MEERTLSQIIENFSSFGLQIAYVQKHGYHIERWSYRQVLNVSRQFAGELNARGIRTGDHVLIWGENCAEWIAAFCGTVMAGAAAVPMDSTASPEFARKVCRQVNPALIVSSRKLPLIGPPESVIMLEKLRETVAGHSVAPYEGTQARSEDPVEIVFTSGTTAEPKGVVLSHKNIISNLEPLETEIRKYLKYEKLVHPLRFLNLLPLSHMFGQYLGIFIPQVIGGTVIFQDTLKPSEIIRTIRRERASVLVTVPKILDVLRQTLTHNDMTESSERTFQRKLRRARDRHFLRRWWIFRKIHRKFGWKFWAFICGGARLGEETEHFWKTLGYAVIQGYGLTETSSLVSVNHPLKISSGTIGKILPGREIKLSPEGEILVRGSSVAESYYQDGRIAPVQNQDGWLSTGDVGELDEAGNLYFKGRRKNVIVSSEGMNIYPEDLEEALKKQPEISDCVVLDLEKQGNPEACAVLLMKDRTQPVEPVIHRANETLAEYQHIRNWFVWPDDDFPRTSTQKPKMTEIRALAASRLQGKRSERTQDGILPEIMRKVTGREMTNISRNNNLARDLDLSSIERVQLLDALEDRFQMDLNETGFTAASTVGDLEAMLAQPSIKSSDYVYPEWAQSRPVKFLRNSIYYLLTRPLTFIMARPKVYGRQHLERLQGPALFISNHVTQVDVAFILAALPGRFRHSLAIAMKGEMLQEMRCPDAVKGLWRRWVSIMKYRLVTALFNVFPLPQESGFRQSFRFAGESADRGFSVLVFPEGGRTRDGEMAHFQTGIGILALNLNVPVVPMRIDGLYALKKEGRRFANPGEVSVYIGKPMQYGYGSNPADIKKDLEEKVRNL